MKSALTSFIVVSFFGIAVFGFLAMSHGGDHSGCIAATVDGTNCPNQGNQAFLNFHLDAFKNFSLATSNALLRFGILLFFALALSKLFAAGKFRLSVVRLWRRKFRESYSFRKHQLTHWLALHELSPSFARAMNN